MSRPKRGEPVQKDVVFKLLPAAIAKATGDGQLESNMRGIFYVVRPGFEKVFGRELNYNTFAGIVTDYENEHGEIESMYRDDRGTLYTPHGEAIALGTRAVRAYERPEWTFNKIVYIEKGSHVSLLRQARWPERHDTAILTSQGMTTRAVRDLFDLLGETEEPLTFFCVHDADGPGSIIYQSLVEETKARAARTVKVINLGLDPDEALEMGLQPEDVEAKKRVPVADYLDAEWHEWLQRHRVELNAMTSPQFIAWIDRKIAPYDDGKVVPPNETMTDALQQAVESEARSRAIDVVSERLDFDRLVIEEAQRIVDEVVELSHEEPLGLVEYVESYLAANPLRRWTDAIASAVDPLIDDGALPEVSP